MIVFEEALRLVEREAFTLGSEKVRLNLALDRVLAEDVVSDVDMPPFDRAAMDGYACRKADLGNKLEVIETIRAGDIPLKAVGSHQCSKIMTGARVPEGADCVLMIEHTVQKAKGHIRFKGKQTAGNIAFRAEDMKAGELALPAGSLIRPQHIAILASAGCTTPSVYKQPRVTVIVTGDELVEPGIKPGGTFIRNSNGPLLTAQIRSMGAVPKYMGIVKDTPEATDSAIKTALDGNDVVIITGGVSMGDFDFVPAVLMENGVSLFFEKVAVKPGRPTVFGRKRDVIFFGLPGNPVSAFIIFELMVKPFLYRMMGHEYQPVVLRLPAGVDYSRKKADRVSWTPVFVNKEGEAIPIEYHGSAHISSLAGSRGLLCMPSGVFSYKKGDLVNVRQI